MQDYYEVLGIDRNADAAAIKQAYYRELKKYHPDTYQGSSADYIKFLNSRTALINEAYSVLSDPAKRRGYDCSGASYSDMGPDNSFFNDLYNNISPENFKRKYEEVLRNLSKMNKGPVEKIWKEVMAMWKFINDPKVPLLKKLMPLAALLYLVMPADLMPDFIPLLGLGDDAAVILFVFYKYHEMLKDYIR